MKSTSMVTEQPTQEVAEAAGSNLQPVIFPPVVQFALLDISIDTVRQVLSEIKLPVAE